MALAHTFRHALLPLLAVFCHHNKNNIAIFASLKWYHKLFFTDMNNI